MTTKQYTALSTNANLYDDRGYLTASGLTVLSDGETIVIGGTVHLASDLIIERDTVRSASAGWFVEL